MRALFWPFLAIQIYLSTASSPITIVSKDILTTDQKLVDGQTLVSPNQRFEMGFFCSRTPCRNSKFLGIWYKDQPELNVVWVANRNRPLRRPLGGKLSIDMNGSLVIEGNSSRVVWNIELMKMPHTSLKKPILQLLDSGNLVVRDGIGKNLSDGSAVFFWESFNFPTDTLLPGMKIGWDLKLGTELMITSWKSSANPSDGHYSFGLDKSQLPQLVQYRNGVRFLRWGPWDGERFSGTNTFKENQLFKPVLVFDENEVSLTMQVFDESTLVRFIVTPLGELHFLKWKNVTREWFTIIAFNKDNCDHVGSCGTYGMCSDPICICLDGFVENSPRDWHGLDCSSGCKREYELNFTDGDGFFKYEGLKLPDNSTVWYGLSPEECGKECLKQSKCMAYTNLNVYGNGTTCIVWLTDLIDMRKSPEAGNDIYIRMAGLQLESMVTSKTNKKVLDTIVVLFSIFSFTLLLGLLFRFLCQLRKAKSQDNHGNNRSREFSTSHEVEDPDITAFDLDKIAAATNNFCRYNKIGHGGFGTVYKGELVGGVEVAVKRLCESSWQGLHEFKNEVSLIAKLQHRNLVKLLGYCLQGSERILVYEFMPNRSLDNFIFDHARRRLLPWETRFKIIMGVAKGLVYLHDDSRLRVIHRDLKASNVLLDSEMNPKISDFGLARIFASETQETTRRVIGTHGYMSPEYMMNGHFSTKSDVYSFGVLLLEIISGKKNWGFHHPDHDYNLLGHGWKMWNEGRPLDAMDPALEESARVVEVIRCIHVGLLCVQHQPEERPTMSQVFCMLRGDNVPLPQPHEPGFFSGRSIMGFGITTVARHIDSVNGLTITTLTGR